MGLTGLQTTDSLYGKNSYFTYSKLFCTGGEAAIGVVGDYNRVIGCTFKDYLDQMRCGVLWVTASKYTSIYGNLFDHDGYDSMEAQHLCKNTTWFFRRPKHLVHVYRLE